ncbi:hypothetical protein PSU4_08640 [Pseudonocardia sulfidoxydans NBRC 16205]|uniref:DUF664 domain-containing protein n=1 Tax=Pseudonocardia sulfidoxydans NBRC 16205 TaxID=1223511 RepID=A0A511DAS6_9PSEU|nr:DUF664 domain-containing protein [Pseudonocardia sulfidoxydans]GEL21910.1 hypothetical protein PSU4_08640 [Pseudonocardia sulfidoxydans NBRC 16205]
MQDDHVSEVAGTEHAWTADGWADRFALPLPDAATATGYGHTPGDVAAVRPTAQPLRGYLAAVTERTTAYLRTVGPDDLDQVVDERWDPPVTLGVRLVSVVDDDAQHTGQAALLRGVLERSCDRSVRRRPDRSVRRRPGRSVRRRPGRSVRRRPGRSV